MDKTNTIHKKRKTKKYVELEIVDDSPPKNITLKSSPHKCNKGTRKYKPLGPGCFVTEDIQKYKLTKKKNKTKS